MNVETRIWNALGILIALITMAVPLWVTYEHFELGGSPEKSAELQTIGPIDPLNDLSALAKGTRLNLSIGDQSYSNIVIWQFGIHNRGKAPISPADFFEPLRVAVDPPWKIIAIRDSELLSGPISLNWKRLEPGVMQAAPFLLNSDDRVWQTVYLTATDRDGGRFPNLTKSKNETSSLKVTARVVNLKQFTKARSSMDDAATRKSALVYLSLRDVLFLLFVASVLLYWYARSLERSGIAKFPSRKAFVLIVFLGILSYSTAEVITFYIFGGDPIHEAVVGRHLLDLEFQFQNWLILLVHISCSIYLYQRAKRNVEVS
jgi:hypothetical protein